MAQIRLVATDVDGTLLDPQGQITPRTRAALRAMEAAGVTLALATARRWTGATLVAAGFDFHGPVILFDGAMTRLYPTGEVQSVFTLERSTAQRMAEAMVAFGVQPIAQYSGEDGEYLHVASEAANPAWTANYLPDFRQQITFRPVAELCHCPDDPVRLVAFGPLTVLRRVAVDLATADCGRQLLLTGSYGHAELTIFASAASKGNALVELAHRLEIPLEETMAVGDGVNDVSMLRAAGLGVAMGQAPGRVRRSANVLTVSNADDGLARAIETHVLSQTTSVTKIVSRPTVSADLRV